MNCKKCANYFHSKNNKQEIVLCLVIMLPPLNVITECTHFNKKVPKEKL